MKFLATCLLTLAVIAIFGLIAIEIATGNVFGVPR